MLGDDVPPLLGVRPGDGDASVGACQSEVEAGCVDPEEPDSGDASRLSSFVLVRPGVLGWQQSLKAVLRQRVLRAELRIDLHDQVVSAGMNARDTGGVGAVVDRSAQPLEHGGLQSGLVMDGGRYRVLPLEGLEVLEAGLVPDASASRAVAGLLREELSVTHQRS
ncbi:hypothetical protein [Streptomyces sp. NPDC055642]